MSTKLPPKQQTQIFRSSRELTKTANFRQFIGRLFSVGVELDPVRTHAGPGDSFEFELVHTKTSIGHLIRTTLSSGSISAVFPRNAPLEQHVLIVGVLTGTLALTQRGETRHFKRGDFFNLRSAHEHDGADEKARLFRKHSGFRELLLHACWLSLGILLRHGFQFR